ncbi:hypothetical protein NESM_000406100 [Novymonas esmeraldas]|uniref:Uncharacterized protein n=1 Tax=Novymonas esmeraldas TaxID=1808958 RepID=A0AAW0ELD5_9TRYP
MAPLPRLAASVRPCWSTPRPRPAFLAATTAVLPWSSASTATASVSTSSHALTCSRRCFYEKIRDKRDGSEAAGPDEMFHDFPKSPTRQAVPVELHRSNADAVRDAETLNAVFCGILAVLLSALIYALNPFRSDPYSRPEGYGMTEPKLVYGSSDLAGRGR